MPGINLGDEPGAPQWLTGLRTPILRKLQEQTPGPVLGKDTGSLSGSWGWPHDPAPGFLTLPMRPDGPVQLLPEGREEALAREADQVDSRSRLLNDDRLPGGEVGAGLAIHCQDQ